MNRLGEDFEPMPRAASPVRLDGNVRLPGNENHEALGNDFEYANRGFDTGDAPHDDIADKDVGSALCGYGDGLFSAVDRFGFVAAQAQDLRQGAGDDTIVIRDQYVESPEGVW